MGVDEMRERIAKQLAELGPDEVEVIGNIVARMTMGRRQYGELRIGNDRRNWGNELEAEILDGMIYAEIELTKRRRSL